MSEFTLAEIAASVNASVQGDANCIVTNIASIRQAKAGELSFILAPQYMQYLSETAASAVLLPSEQAQDCHLPAIVMENPKLGLAKILNLFYPQIQQPQGIHPTAQIGKGCQLAADVTIGPHCVLSDGVIVGEKSVIDAGTVIGANTHIGAHCHLHAKVTIYQQVIVGDHAIIHSGVILGADGFGFAQDQGHWVKIPQVGSVHIGKAVEIGANSTIDRGTLDDTVIGDGVKIDNQVQIGHNCRIGDHTVIAGCTGIAGSTEIGRYCVIGGGACIGDHLQITDHVIIGGMGAVGQSVTEPGVYSSGIAITKNKQWRRNMLRFQQLDKMAKRIRQLEIRCDESDGC